MLIDADHIRSALSYADTDATKLCQQYGSPFYLYDAQTIRYQYHRLNNALKRADLSQRYCVHYAIKANDRLGILRILKKLGAGGDLVSIGEMQRAFEAGFESHQLVYSGVGKTANDLYTALTTRIGQINIESISEWQLLNQIATEIQHPVNISFRLNPNICAGGHKNISTATSEHKFGMSPNQIVEALNFSSSWISVVGISLHLGSQITDINVYIEAFNALNQFLHDINFEPEVLDFGGGFGINYNNSNNDIFDLNIYTNAIKKIFADRPCRLIIEPGRFLVASSGILVFRTLLEKKSYNIRWIITEMAMNDLMRPALYQAKHRLSILSDFVSGPIRSANLGGPICESTDTIGEYNIPTCPPNTILALHDVGAYGSVMSNSYNSRSLPAELMLDEKNITLLRRAITTQDWLNFESSVHKENNCR